MPFPRWIHQSVMSSGFSLCIKLFLCMLVYTVGCGSQLSAADCFSTVNTPLGVLVRQFETILDYLMNHNKL